MLSPSMRTKSNGNFCARPPFAARPGSAVVAAARIANDREAHRSRLAAAARADRRGAGARGLRCWVARRRAARRARHAAASSDGRPAASAPPIGCALVGLTDGSPPPGIHPSATNCTDTWPRFGESSIRSSSSARRHSVRRSPGLVPNLLFESSPFSLIASTFSDARLTSSALLHAPADAASRGRGAAEIANADGLPAE